MPGSVILSDDFWLLGPSFAHYIETDLKPEGIGVENMRPDSVDAENMRPQSVSVSFDDADYRPRSATAKELKPIGRTRNLRPKSKKVEET